MANKKFRRNNQFCSICLNLPNLNWDSILYLGSPVRFLSFHDSACRTCKNLVKWQSSIQEKTKNPKIIMNKLNIGRYLNFRPAHPTPWVYREIDRYVLSPCTVQYSVDNIDKIIEWYVVGDGAGAAGTIAGAVFSPDPRVKGIPNCFENDNFS